jgi:hypothetical protein
MSAGRLFANALFCVAALLCLSLTSWGERALALPAEGKPRLAVLVVFDQMRGDYLIRWRDLFEKDGFRRLTDGGAWYQNCHYPYANTMTGPGHATVATGCSPDVHGIVANDWFDLKLGEPLYCAASVRHEQVPPPLKATRAKGSSAPVSLLAPTIGDALKLATGGKGKVVALSLKDRASVLPAGHSKPDAVLWVDREGRLVTSTYYRTTLHPWARELNSSGLATRWMGKKWERLRKDVDYDKHAGPDDVIGEVGKGGLTRTFPHLLDGGPKKEKSVYLATLAASPFGNDVLLEAAGKAIDGEKLGQRGEQDLLSISFSSNDIVGHAWGPDSHEVLDVTLRSDLIVRDLLKMLDAKVGKGKYIVVVTADHGICPLPEVSRKKGRDAKRVPTKPIFKAAEAMLNRKWPARAGQEGGGFIEATVSNMVYYNRAELKQRGVKVEDAARELAKWLPTQPGIQAAYTAEQLKGKIDAKDRIGRAVQRSFHAGRSGDVSIVQKPFYLLASALAGTTHGTPHEYDTHVPLVVYGAGVKAGVRKERVSPEAAAVILAAGLGIKPPAKAAVKVPAGLFGE